MKDDVAEVRGLPDVFETGRVGLAVMEMQVVHHGHVGLLMRMRAACGKCILALGSSNSAGKPGHPFTFRQRKEMVEGLFGPGAFAFVSLNDIHAGLPDEWTDYVLTRVAAIGLPRPTDYFAGSRLDARWYEKTFAPLDGPGVPSGIETAWHAPGEPGGTTRALRIIDREANDMPSARIIREMIEMREPGWRLFVPERLWRYVEWTYPPEMRVPVRSPSVPTASDHPVGTLWTADGREVLILRDDGKWRPNLAQTDEKGDFARASAANRTGRRLR